MENKFSENVAIVFVPNDKMREQKETIERLENILALNDTNFVPSLFERIEFEGTLKEKVNFRIKERLDDKYNYLLAFYNGEIVGFTELKFEIREIIDVALYTISIGTSVIDPRFQGKGIAKRLYSTVEEIAVKANAQAVTRATWSLNCTQLNLYNKFGYSEYERIKDGRGPGNDLIKFYKLF